MKHNIFIYIYIYVSVVILFSYFLFDFCSFLDSVSDNILYIVNIVR